MDLFKFESEAGAMEKPEKGEGRPPVAETRWAKGTGPMPRRRGLERRKPVTQWGKEAARRKPVSRARRRP